MIDRLAFSHCEVYNFHAVTEDNVHDNVLLCFVSIVCPVSFAAQIVHSAVTLSLFNVSHVLLGICSMLAVTFIFVLSLVVWGLRIPSIVSATFAKFA